MSCFVGGVFITWRQKDPKEPDLGLYGKRAFSKPSDIIDSNDIYLVNIRDDIKHDTEQKYNLTKRKRKRPNIAHNRTILNSLWKREISKFSTISHGVYLSLVVTNRAHRIVNHQLSSHITSICSVE